MRAGDVYVDGAETFTITRSAAGGDRLHFELKLGSGASGPPVHTHEEIEEIEVISGSVIFWLDGVERRFSAGDKFVIPVGCAHTFKNASKTEVLHARGTHSGRFERLLDQLAAGGPSFLRLALYLSSVDPRASYMVNPVVRASLRVAALFARIRGVTVAAATGAYGLDAPPASPG